MKVRSLRLQGFGGFDDATIEFDPFLTVLVGANGSGKTTVLNGLAHILFLHANSDFGFGKEEFRSNGEPLSMAFSLRHPGGEYTYQHLAPAAGWAPTRTSSGVPPTEEVLWVHFSSARTIHHLIAAKPLSGPDGVIYHNDRVDFEAFTAWFRKREDIENERNARRADNEPKKMDPGLEAVRQAVTTLLPGVSNLRIERERGAMLVDKGTTELQVDRLSDGEKSLLAMTGDLARRLLEHFPNEPNPLHCEALVMIDEIELHLHPGWQRRVIERLRKTFPNCQFVITTHSPQVLGSVPSKSIVVLDDFKVFSAPAETLGRDSNAILADVLGDYERPKEMIDELHKVGRAIDEGNLDVARAELDRLETTLTAQDAEIVRYRTLLHFLAGDEDAAHP